MWGALCKEKNTLSCYSIVNKIAIRRTVSHLLPRSPVLAHVSRPLCVSLRNSVTSVQTHSCFCLTSLLAFFILPPIAYLSSLDCVLSIVLTVVYSSALFPRLFSIVSWRTGNWLFIQTLSGTKPYPYLHGYFRIVACHPGRYELVSEGTLLLLK